MNFKKFEKALMSNHSPKGIQKKRIEFMKQCSVTYCDRKRASIIVFHEKEFEPEYVCDSCMSQIVREREAIYKYYGRHLISKEDNKIFNKKETTKEQRSAILDRSPVYVFAFFQRVFYQFPKGKDRKPTWTLIPITDTVPENRKVKSNA